MEGPRGIHAQNHTGGKKVWHLQGHSARLLESRLRNRYRGKPFSPDPSNRSARNDDFRALSQTNLVVILLIFLQRFHFRTRKQDLNSVEGSKFALSPTKLCAVTNNSLHEQVVEQTSHMSMLFSNSTSKMAITSIGCHSSTNDPWIYTDSRKLSSPVVDLTRSAEARSGLRLAAIWATVARS